MSFATLQSVKRFTTATLSCATPSIGVLFATIIAAAFYVHCKDGTVPSLIKKGIAMVQAHISPFLIGLVSSYIAGLALLP